MLLFTGCWYKYTFSENSSGFPINLGKNFQPWSLEGGEEDDVMETTSINELPTALNPYMFNPRRMSEIRLGRLGVLRRRPTCM